MHRRKIGEITSGVASSQYKVNSDYTQFKRHLIKQKLRSFEFKETQKNEQINKSNAVLLRNLLEISKGKRVSINFKSYKS